MAETKVDVEAQQERLKALYAAYDAISKAGEEAATSCIAQYTEIMNAGVDQQNPKARGLAAQLIPRILHLFPTFAEDTLNRQIDLCEDEVAEIRVFAVLGLAEIGKKSPGHVSRIADILSQLLMTDDGKELAAVKRSFTQMFSVDSKASFDGLFSQITGGEEGLRSSCINFLRETLKHLATLIRASEELQRHLVDRIKGVLTHESGITHTEFKTFLDTVASFPIYRKDAALSQELAAVVKAQARLDQDFEATDEAAVLQYASCMTMSAPFFRKGASNAEFIDHFFTKVPAKMGKLTNKLRLVVLKALCDAIPYTPAETAAAAVPPCWRLIKRFIPRAPAEGEEKKTTAKLNFQAVECLLFAFHALADKAPGAVKAECAIFVPTGQPSDYRVAQLDEKRQDVKSRISFLTANLKTHAASVRDVKKKLEQKIRTSKDVAEKKELQSKLAPCNTALRSVRAIEVLAKALVQDRPHFKPPVVLSWKPQRQQKGQKRPAGAAAGNANKKSKPNQQGGGKRGGKRGQQQDGPPTKRRRANSNGGRGRGRGRGRGGRRGRGRGRGRRGGY